MKKIIAFVLLFTICIVLLSGCKENTVVFSSTREENLNSQPFNKDITSNEAGIIVTDMDEIPSNDKHTTDYDKNIITNYNKVEGNEVTNKKPSTDTNKEPQNTTQNNNDKSLVFNTENNLFGKEEVITDNYIYPDDNEIKFKLNSTNIYENKYLKVDATKSNLGCLFITYKDSYATEIKVTLDITSPYGGHSQGSKRFYFSKQDFDNNKTLMIPYPIEDALYYLSISSTINEVTSTKFELNLGRVTFDGAISYEYIYPDEETIKLKQTSTGIYSNDYVSINTNCASKGYVEIEYKENNGYDITVEISTNVKSKYGHFGKWHYNTLNKGPCNIKAALTYGNAVYTISVFSSIINDKTNVGGCTKKGEITVSLNNVSPTDGFLFNGGEVRYTYNMQFIKKASEIASTCKSDLEKVSKIYDWLTSYISYGNNGDYTALGLYTCDLERIYNAKKGVCYDFAVVLAAMLRSQGIPCKVVFGRYTDSSEGHVWNQVYVSGSGEFTSNKVSITANKWCRLDPTFSYVNSGTNAIEFIKNDTNYSWRCYY